MRRRSGAPGQNASLAGQLAAVAAGCPRSLPVIDRVSRGGSWPVSRSVRRHLVCFDVTGERPRTGCYARRRPRRQHRSQPRRVGVTRERPAVILTARSPSVTIAVQVRGAATGSSWQTSCSRICRRRTRQDLLNGQLRQHQVGRDIREVKHQRLDAEPAFACRVDLAVNRVQVAVVHVGPAPFNL
jgi:hypothetical protein